MNDSTRTCHLAIIGAGPGGHTAAEAAAKAGLKTILVEKADIGGTCLNRGCIPTKLFLGATQALVEHQAQKRLGIATGDPGVSLPALQKRKRAVVEGTRKAVATHLTKLGVDIIKGAAILTGDHSFSVATESGDLSVTYGKLIIATGSRPSSIPGLEPDGHLILNSDHALDLEEAPASLAVIGAGAIGVEMAQFFARIGTKVTLIEVMPQIAPSEDPEIAAMLARILKRHGLNIHAGVKSVTLDPAADAVNVCIDGGQPFSVSKVLVAAGRRPNTQDLGLETTGGKTTPKGFILTDENLQAAPDIYAIGDVNGRTLLAHAASHQAEYVVRRVAGLESYPYLPGPMPGCFYGEPEIMRVGLTAAELAERGLEPEVSRASLTPNPIAQAHGSTQGLIKVVWCEGRVRGISAVGFAASHLLTLATVIVAQGWTVERASEIIYPHPTLDEALKDALLAPREKV